MRVPVSQRGAQAGAEGSGICFRAAGPVVAEGLCDGVERCQNGGPVGVVMGLCTGLAAAQWTQASTGHMSTLAAPIKALGGASGRTVLTPRVFIWVVETEILLSYSLMSDSIGSRREREAGSGA